jgi:hypothetical protein
MGANIMTVKIHRTTVTPAEDGEVVQLYVSDAPPGDVSASFVLDITARVPTFESPLLLHVQREAMDKAQKVLSEYLRELADRITRGGADLHPRVRS